MTKEHNIELRGQKPKSLSDKKKVTFKKIGRKKQHEVTLFSIFERPFDPFEKEKYDILLISIQENTDIVEEANKLLLELEKKKEEFNPILIKQGNKFSLVGTSPQRNKPLILTTDFNSEILKELKFSDQLQKIDKKLIPSSIYEEFELKKSHIAQSPSEKMLTYYEREAKFYLKSKGYEDTTDLFEVVNGKIKKAITTLGIPLVEAIKQRDEKQGGQTGEYLAALIDYYCQTIKNSWPPEHHACSAILDYALLIQQSYFHWYLLEDIHAPFSAGNSRINEENYMKPYYEEEAKNYFLELRKGDKKLKKEKCYMKIADELKKKHPHDPTPTASTIKSWLKNWAKNF